MTHVKGRCKFDTREVFVSIDGDREVKLLPGHSQSVVNHSPDGFNWGYGGSGPAQLALAVCLVAGMPDLIACNAYEQFKWDCIANLPQRDCTFEVWMCANGDYTLPARTH